MLTTEQRDRVLSLSEGANDDTLQCVQAFSDMHSRIQVASAENVDLSITLLELGLKCKANEKPLMANLCMFMASCAVNQTDRKMANMMFARYVAAKVQATGIAAAIAQALSGPPPNSGNDNPADGSDSQSEPE